ncbi:MAG: condensation domain-containing protein, partial [Burkholderiaceae bacterium]
MKAEFAADQEAAQLGGTIDSDVAPVRADAALPMSYSQEQLWFLQRLDPAMTAYNLPRVLRLRGAVDADALERAFQAVIERHAVLRTRFFEKDGVPMQQVLPAAAFGLQRTDLSKRRGARKDEALEQEVRAIVSHVFDLGTAPVIVAKLVRLSASEHVLVFCMHHIVSDAWSNPILAKDLSDAYRIARASSGEVHLPALQQQYADYAVWQRAQADGGKWAEQLAYWNRYLGGEVPVLELPSDRPRSGRKSFDGADLTFALPKPIEEAVRRFCKAERLTPFVPLFAAWQVLLAKYSGQSDFAIGVPNAGRGHED